MRTGSYTPDDLSWYANIPVPTSYMISSTKEDFFGGYDHRAKAGVLHYADHHIAPGKKQWTWGNHEFGYAWDRSLTDGDGPYVELMAGVYTDNQPDFSFLAPGETKTFSQYWYPLNKIGVPKAASLHCALSVRVEPGAIEINVQSTSDLENATVTLLVAGTIENSWTVSISAGTPLHLQSQIPDSARESDVEVKIEQGAQLLLRYAPGEMQVAPPPRVAEEPLPPSEIASNEQLYLTGLHLAQYRHATRRPEMYWQEAVRRDDGDARANTALGRWHLDRGEFELAERCLRRAIARLTMLNPNPADGEAFFLLGLVMRFLNNLEASYDNLAKAAWNDAWKGPAHYALAQIDAARGHWESAYMHVERSLNSNVEDLNARNLAAVLLRRLHRTEDAARMLRSTRALDPLDHWSRHLDGGEIPSDNQALLDLVWDYVEFGETETAVQLLRSADLAIEDGSVPMVQYTLAYLLHRIGRMTEAAEARRAAARAPSDYCFPHRLHDMQVLQAAIESDSSDARAPYYLGNLLYDRRRHEEAITMWERSIKLDTALPTVYRNLGIALFNVRGDVGAGIAAFDRAMQADPSDGRILYERDQLWKRTGTAPQKRLRELLNHSALVEERDDLSVEVATLHNHVGNPEEALALLLSRNFQPWEGGEGLVLGQFTRALVLLARLAIASGKPAEAIAHLQQALRPPVSLGEARHPLANKSDIEYWLGVAYEAAGNRPEAESWWTRASRQAGDFQQMSMLPVSDMTYWRGAALQRLGEAGAAMEVFGSIDAYATRLEQEQPKIDYFATSLPAMLLFREDLGRRQHVLVSFLRAQVVLGSSGMEAAKPLLRQLLVLDVNHAAAADLLQQVTSPLRVSNA